MPRLDSGEVSEPLTGLWRVGLLVRVRLAVALEEQLGEVLHFGCEFTVADNHFVSNHSGICENAIMAYKAIVRYGKCVPMSHGCTWLS